MQRCCIITLQDEAEGPQIGALLAETLALCQPASTNVMAEMDN